MSCLIMVITNIIMIAIVWQTKILIFVYRNFVEELEMEQFIGF